MSDPYLLRRVREDEFPAWVRTINNTYGEDRNDQQVAAHRLAVELDRTLAALDGETIVGGAALATRVLTVPGALVPTAGVDLVGVAPTHRRRGILTALMRRQLTDLHEAGVEPLAGLYAAEAGIYGRFGYGVAVSGARVQGEKRSMAFRAGVDLGSGTLRLVSRADARPLLEKVFEQVRVDAVGWLDRPSSAWEYRLDEDEGSRAGATTWRYVVHSEPGGAVTGYALYRLKAWTSEPNTVRVGEVVATTRPAAAALWRFLADIDLHPRLEYEGALDDPLPHLLLDPRALTATVADRVWLRLVDVDRALAARRYATELDVVLDVTDAFCPWNAGRYRLRAAGDEVSCEPTTNDADLRLSAAELGAAYLGGTTLAALGAAGRVEEVRADALARASLAFRGEREPFYPAGSEFPTC